MHTPPLTTETYTGHLLPGPEDELRWRAEDAVRRERRLRVTVHSLRESLLGSVRHFLAATPAPSTATRAGGGKPACQ